MNITIYDLKDHLSSIISFDEENLISLLTNSKICHSVSNNEPVLGVHWKRGEIENNWRWGHKVKSSVEGKHVDMIFVQNFTPPAVWQISPLWPSDAKSDEDQIKSKQSLAVNGHDDSDFLCIKCSQYAKIAFSHLCFVAIVKKERKFLFLIRVSLLQNL